MELDIDAVIRVPGYRHRPIREVDWAPSIAILKQVIGFIQSYSR